ncbi:MAG: HAMP domain-containing histidine kinase [Lachnospiraceae bacterium]|nr:HAMP domain-containing histidine kinase [Lachnospiraceae bacterium]
MKEYSYQRNRKRYERRVRMLYACSLLLVVSMAVIMYFYVGKWLPVVIVIGCGVGMIGIMRLLQCTDDICISQIVAALSDLLDSLSELERQEVFPENEDTLLSKLQSKTDKIVTTLRLQNDRERAEHENIKGLVSDLSHQLKTPISNLKMYTEFLKDPYITMEERQQYLHILDLSVERLLFLSEGMIKVSRLESGLITLHCEKQSINETILQAVKDIYASAKRADIMITYKEEVRCDILHDRRWTAEACFNLLDNAVKYGKSGDEIILAVRELGLTIEISVTDQNEPISEEERTRIFERFYRGQNAVEKEGVGIGLYLVREIIEKEGGCLSVCLAGHGNRFSIVLPKQFSDV